MFAFVKKHLSLSWVLCFFVPLLLDRVTKYLIVSGVVSSQVVCSIFNIYVTTNHGVAWSLGSDLSEPWACVLKTCIAMVLGYFAWYMRAVADNRVLAVASLLVLSGGISNFFDRLWYGSVIDFLQFHYQNYYFPTFNVADVGITLGAALLLYGTCTDTQKS